MGRKRKSGLEHYWLENCRNCKHMLLIHCLENGVDNGLVIHRCKIKDEMITPWEIDGCKKFEYGDIEILIREKENRT